MRNELFKQQPNMLLELKQLEELFPDAQPQLQLLSKNIRNNIWNSENEHFLVIFLRVLNIVFSLLYDIFQDGSFLVSMYIDYLKNLYINNLYKINPFYYRADIERTFNTLLLEVSKMNIKSIIDKQWKRINPYYSDKFDPDVLKDSKNFIEIIDDVFTNISRIDSDIFIKQLSFTDDYTLARCRREVWKDKEDLSPPSIEIAKKYNIINRWNPPDKRYLYLSIGNSLNAQETVLSEMRAKPGETFTIGEFHVLDYARNNLIVNLDYYSVSETEIFSQLNNKKDDMVSKIVEQFTIVDSIPSQDEIKEAIDTKHSEIETIATLFSVQLFLKEICDEIFVPLGNDEDSDPDKRDRCYKSFHKLAEYFEEKGFAGILFPSTRMMLKGKNGTNLVLFDADCAEAYQESLDQITL